MPNHISPFVSEQAEAIQREGNEIDYFLVEGKGLKSYYEARRALKTKIEKFLPDVIHAHYGLCGITACSQKRIPVVTTFHNGETLSAFVNLISSLYSLKASHVVYVAQHIYDKCYFKRKDRFCIQPCGVNLEDYELKPKDAVREQLGMLSDKKYILFGGAFDNLRKNYPLLKDGLELLKRDDVEVLEMKGLSRNQVANLMCACDLFCLPTKSEGSPQALKEAMACNCPIVATDVADIKYLLGDLPGHYICTFEPENVAQQVGKALAFGGRTEGRNRVLELGLTNGLVAKRLSSIYSSLIK